MSPRSTTTSTVATPPPVAIEEGKTIDFSSGKPEVRATPEDRAIMEAALKEMAEAAKDISFGPEAKK